jgi:hypothetical protein
MVPWSQRKKYYESERNNLLGYSDEDSESESENSESEEETDLVTGSETTAELKVGMRDARPTEPTPDVVRRSARIPVPKAVPEGFLDTRTMGRKMYTSRSVKTSSGNVYQA